MSQHLVGVNAGLNIHSLHAKSEIRLLLATIERTHQSTEHDGYQAASGSAYDKIKDVTRFGELVVIVAWLEDVHQALQNKKADKTADSTSICDIFGQL